MHSIKKNTFLGFFLLLRFIVVGQCGGDASVIHTINLGDRSSGEIRIDAEFNQAKTHLEDFFGITADLYFYKDSLGAQALTLCSSLHSDIYDGTIRFGLTLLKNELRIKDEGVQSAVAVLAHEFAHIFQCRSGSSLLHFKRELQADFLAGYFLGRKSYEQKYKVDIIPFAVELFHNDDWYNSFYYGTSNERAQAMIDGYHNGDLNLEAAYIKSLYHFNSYIREEPEAKRVQQCGLCAGEGVTDRPTECSICLGHGHLKCNICEGEGKFSLFNKKHPCDACAESGIKTCAGCDGEGIARGAKLCPKCTGKKQILKSEAESKRP